MELLTEAASSIRSSCTSPLIPSHLLIMIARWSPYCHLWQRIWQNHELIVYKRKHYMALPRWQFEPNPPLTPELTSSRMQQNTLVIQILGSKLTVNSMIKVQNQYRSPFRSLKNSARWQDMLTQTLISCISTLSNSMQIIHLSLKFSK